MRKYNFAGIMLISVLLVATIFPARANANYLLSGTSGTIAGTTLQYTDLNFTDDINSVKIRNNGLPVKFSARIQILDNKGKILMESWKPLGGNIPSNTVVSFSSAYPYIYEKPANRGVIYQTKWVDVSITLLEK